MGWPWSAAHAEDIAAAAVAAREAFVSGTPLDQALQLHVGSQDTEKVTINANCPAETEPSLDPDPDGPINWPALIESYRERKISSGELKSSTWVKIWQPRMREVIAVMQRHPAPSQPPLGLHPGPRPPAVAPRECGGHHHWLEPQASPDLMALSP
jgi:hypothetical protein